jgi:hypothetical protein
VNKARWALERLVREPWLIATFSWMEGMSDTLRRRLQLAAERFGQTLILLRREARGASWGALRLYVHGVAMDQGGRTLMVETLRARGRMPCTVRIELDEHTQAVRKAATVSQAGGRAHRTA